MTAGADGAPPADSAGTTALENEARSLARTQQHLQRAQRARVRRAVNATTAIDSLPFGVALARAERQLTCTHFEDASRRKAVEWFLDNHYFVRRVARQVQDELPRGFVRRLPELASGPSRGQRRIDALVREIVARSGLELDRGTLLRFVLAYEEVTPLTDRRALGAARRPSRRRPARSGPAPGRADGPASRRRARAHAGRGSGGRAMHPRAARTGRPRLDHLLRGHESGGSDAAARPHGRLRADGLPTCDAYRRAVEELAWGSDASEVEVATRAVRLAREGALDPRRGHVGYYLVDAGRGELEAEVGYRPSRLERVRRAVTGRPTLAYFVPLVVFAALLLGAAYAVYFGASGGRALTVVLVAMAAVVPLWSIALTILQLVLARLLLPRVLPKLDFASGIDPAARTLVVIPTVLARAEDVEGMLRQIELHYLANPDPQPGLRAAHRQGGLARGAEPEQSGREAAEGITRLNDKHGTEGNRPFHLLHRERHWNASEGRFMGWERKRGKLEELNRLLRGAKKTTLRAPRRRPDGLSRHSLRHHARQRHGAAEGLRDDLVGLLAHPLNRAVFDADGRASRGIRDRPAAHRDLSPRARAAPFGRILAGDGARHLHARRLGVVPGPLRLGIYFGKASTTSTRSCAAWTGAYRRTGSRATTSSRGCTGAPRWRRTSCSTSSTPRTTPCT